MKKPIATQTPEMMQNDADGEIGGASSNLQPVQERVLSDGTVGTEETYALQQSNAAHAGTAAPVIYTQGAMASGDYVQAGGIVLKVRKRVALPVLQFEAGQTIVVRIMEAIHIGKELTVAPNGKPKMAPAEICTIASLGGEQRTLICGTVLHKEIVEAYPKDTYVGCWFHITKLAKREGKDYFTYVINEIEPPTEDQMMQRQVQQVAKAA